MTTAPDLLEKYDGAFVLITGGMGFIGSTIAHRLVALGAKVTILDNLAPLYGGNPFNLSGIEGKVSVIKGDLRDRGILANLVPDKQYIFDLAAQVSPIDSNQIPFEDLSINCEGHLALLEACRSLNQETKIVFASSRLALGKITENPVTENHPAHPLNLYGIHKLAGEQYYGLYHKIHGLHTTVLRLTNPYGERQQIKHSKYSIPGWFTRIALEGNPITIFGDGSQLRDYIHVSDVADAFLLVGATRETDGELYNCGSGTSISLAQMAEEIVRTAGNGSIVHVPWPSNYAKEETGNFETDISKIQKSVPWKPRISFEEGISRMCRYYREYAKYYVPVE